MKRLYVAAVLLAIVIALCGFEQYTVISTYKTSNEYINAAIEEVESDDLEKAEESCKGLEEYWEKRLPYMAAMIDHSSLDEASVSINSLCDFAEKGSDDLESELITVKNQIENIYEGQKITIGNIF